MKPVLSFMLLRRGGNTSGTKGARDAGWEDACYHSPSVLRMGRAVDAARRADGWMNRALMPTLSQIRAGVRGSAEGDLAG